MGQIAYFDAFSGLSGDMTIGAFLDLGLPLETLKQGLAPLGLREVELEVGHRTRSGIRATKFTVHAPGLGPGDHPHHAHAHAGHDHDSHVHGRSYREVKTLLSDCDLNPGVREKAEKIFYALAVAEARIHACPIDEIGFHEVGAIDALVDIVGAAICFEHFGIEKAYVSPLPLGKGLIRSQHGVIPVPAPATVEILRGFACRLEDGSAELVTPTGAAIVAALATSKSPPALSPVASGYGAGDRELDDRPNLLRIILAEETATVSAKFAPSEGLEADDMVVLEANVDDMNPEFFESAMEALFEAGARDVSLCPVIMKRNRPGTLIQVIAEPLDRDRLGNILLRETSTIGIRTYPVSRLMLPRRRDTVDTPYGSLPVKIVDVPGGEQRVTPEYSACKKAAREHGVPVSLVYQEALRAAWGQEFQ